MTTTVADLRDFLNDGDTQAYKESDLTKALAQATDYLKKRGIVIADDATGDRITVLQAALFVSTKELKPAGSSSGSATPAGQVSEIKDGDTTIKYATSSSSSSKSTTTEYRAEWQTELDNLILLSDDPIEADYTD